MKSNEAEIFIHDQHGMFDVLDESLLAVIDATPVAGGDGGSFFDGLCAKVTNVINTDCHNDSCGNIGCANTDCGDNINGVCSPIL